MSTFSLLLLTFLVTGLLQAGLTFDQDPLELKPKPEDEEIETDFTFKNTGTKPITVTGLESSCSCLEASLDKAIYQPGEKGVGKAKFKISSFQGRHEKFLHIFTDDPDNADIVMRAVIEVPVIIEIEPKILQWALNEKPAPKAFTIKMVGDEALKVTNVSSTRESFTYELKEVKPGREYSVTLTPKTTESIIIGALKIETDSKIPKFQRQMAFFSIVRPEQLEKQKAKD